MSSVVIHQPEYLPWANLFFKIYKCDNFIFLDNVQYSRRSFQNRNLIGKDGSFEGNIDYYFADGLSQMPPEALNGIANGKTIKAKWIAS